MKILPKATLNLLLGLSLATLGMACGEAVGGEAELESEVSALVDESAEGSTADPCDFESRRAEFVQRHDTDGDGELSREERRAVKQARRERIRAEFDVDGDGELSEEERTSLRDARRARRDERRAQVLQCFDADGDGELSAEERQTLREALPRRPGKRQRRGGDRPEASSNE